jgi:diguanylate cyclase (GGDEF)-like protein
MAASDPNPRSDRLQPSVGDCLTPAALSDRLQEEIGRAERHSTGLSCLLIVIDNLDQMAREHGGELREQTVDYVASALRRELRRFDRVGRVGLVGGDEKSTGRDLLILLPGADGPRGEIVARRALERLRTIKIEAGGTRQPLQISVGLSAWHGDVSAQDMVGRARAAMRSVNGDQGANGEQSGHPLAPDRAAAQARQPAEARSANLPASGP